MSMRQLHKSDRLQITVTDENGRHQGILIARADDWCWVLWNEMEAPTTEHIRELWICDHASSLLERAVEYGRVICSPQMALGA